MKFVQLEGEHPLEKPKWEGNYLFPHQLFKVRPRLPAWGSPRLPVGCGVWGDSRSPPQTLLCELHAWAACPGGQRRSLPCSPSPQSVVGGLLSADEDHSLLLCQFREYLEHDDIRYHTMQAATDAVARATDGRPEVSRLGPGRVEGGGGHAASGRSGPVCGRCPSLFGTTPSRCCPP